MDNDTLAKLLTEIRDGNQQLLEEYRRLASESLAISETGARSSAGCH